MTALFIDIIKILLHLFVEFTALVLEFDFSASMLEKLQHKLHKKSLHFTTRGASTPAASKFALEFLKPTKYCVVIGFMMHVTENMRFSFQSLLEFAFTALVLEFTSQLKKLQHKVQKKSLHILKSGVAL